MVKILEEIIEARTTVAALNLICHNDTCTELSDRHVWASSNNPDQAAPFVDTLLHRKQHYSNFRTGPVAQVVECLLHGMGGNGFDPGPRHTSRYKWY